MKIVNCKLKIHFVGIGGIALSGLANIYLQKGCEVQGSDAQPSEITEELQGKGINVFIGHKEKNITEGIDLIIYSEAVPENNVELKAARQLGINCQTGAQALGELSKQYFTIAVSGMHGKTTTACMVAHILLKAGLDITYVIGTKDGSRLGKSKYLVIEADDYKAKFLNYHPNILVLTNIEEEHMDYFHNLGHILEVFKKYISQVKDLIIVAKSDRNIKKVITGALCEIKYFEPQNIKLQVPGLHNQYNAAAALEVALALKIDENLAKKALSDYKGAWRRLQEKAVRLGEKDIIIISDYAHHPTEILATTQAIGEKYPNKKVWCVFQPHQHQRTFYLFEKFVKAFESNPFEKLIITDIYDVQGREDTALKERVSAEKLVKAIKRGQTIYLPKGQIIDYLKKHLQGEEIVVIMGAGDIYKLINQL